MRMMESEYQTALRIPSTLDLLFFKKTLTVTGTSGNTQGVKTAAIPNNKHFQKIDHSDLSPVSSTTFTASPAFIFTEKLSSPCGYVSIFLASHVTRPDPPPSRLTAYRRPLPA